MRHKWTLAVLLVVGSAQAASTLFLKQLVGTGYIRGLQCFAGAQNCEGRTPLAANAFASALGLPAPTATGQEWWPWDTAGRGWRVQHHPQQGEWRVRLTPLGRRLSAAELQAYPLPKQTWVPRPAHVSREEQAAPIRGAAGTDQALAPRGTQAPGQFRSPSPPAESGSGVRLPVCTVVIDVRGLGRMDRDMTSVVYDAQGQQLWPDATLVQGTTAQLMGEGNLHSYVSSEAQLAPLGKVTRVKALRLQPPRVAPNSPIRTNAVLGPNAAREFRSAGSACRVVYLLTP